MHTFSIKSDNNIMGGIQMFKKLGLSVVFSAVLLVAFSGGITTNAAANEQNNHEKVLEIIEKAEQLSQTSEKGIFIIDDHEVSLGEKSFASEDFADNTITPFSTTFRLTGKASVSRPLLFGVMTATATSTTNVTAYRVRARANVNNNGDSMSNGTWKMLYNTTFTSASTAGKTRTGIGHGNHEAVRTSTSNSLKVNTTNRDFQK